MKYNGPKARRVRSLGINIYGADKYDRILQRKPYGPGKNPKTRPSRDSEYKKQLKEKQKARGMYGLSERQFRRIYAEASSMRGQTGDLMKQFLERRLDNVIYRSGLARTRLQARQFAGHGLFQVDGVRVTTASFQVRPGHVITIRQRNRTSPIIENVVAANEKYLAPKWLKVDLNARSAEVIALPLPEDAEQALDMQQVVEFYSRN
jgi:small subunit ribosomal protein S4